MSGKELQDSDLTKLEWAVNSLGETVGRALSASQLNYESIRGPHEEPDAIDKSVREAKNPSNRIQSLTNQVEDIRTSADRIINIQHTIEYAVGAPRQKVAQSR
jgi:hypothetical protein